MNRKCNYWYCITQITFSKQPFWKKPVITLKCNLYVETYVEYNLTACERSFSVQLSATLHVYVETEHFRTTNLDDRICSLCGHNEVEDEIHFVLKCPLYNAACERCLKRTRHHEFDIDISLKFCLTQFHHCSPKFIL